MNGNSNRLICCCPALSKWLLAFQIFFYPKAAEWGFSQLLGTSSLLQPEWKSTPSLRLDLADESSQEFERLKALLSQSEQKLDSKALILKKELLKDQEELEQMEKEVRTQKRWWWWCCQEGWEAIWRSAWTG